MTWQPTWTVTIEGVDYTGDALIGGRITYGTQDPTDQIRAATGRITLVNGLDGLAIDVMDSVSIVLATSTATAPVFTGYVSDVVYSMDGRGVSIVDLVVMSPLAKYVRRNAGAVGFPKQFDGERIAAILAEAQSVTWQEEGGTWLEAVGTWADLDSLIGTIATGDYELALLAANGQSAYSLLALAELSGMGHLGERPTGKVDYQASSDRLTDAATNGFTDLPAAVVLLDGVSAQMSTSTITNDSTVITDGGHVGQTVDKTSVGIYGRYATTTQTQLHNNSDALTQSTRTVKLYGRPRRYLSDLQMPLSQLDTATRDVLIGDIRRGLPVRVYGLPAAIAGDPFAGFVEGWTWELGNHDVFLTLSVSDYALSVPSQSWAAVSNTITWATISGSPTWDTLEVVA